MSPLKPNSDLRTHLHLCQLFFLKHKLHFVYWFPRIHSCTLSFPSCAALFSRELSLVVGFFNQSAPHVVLFDNFNTDIFVSVHPTGAEPRLFKLCQPDWAFYFLPARPRNLSRTLFLWYLGLLWDELRPLPVGIKRRPWGPRCFAPCQINPWATTWRQVHLSVNQRRVYALWLPASFICRVWHWDLFSRPCLLWKGGKHPVLSSHCISDLEELTRPMFPLDSIPDYCKIELSALYSGEIHRNSEKWHLAMLIKFKKRIPGFILGSNSTFPQLQWNLSSTFCTIMLRGENYNN